MSGQALAFFVLTSGLPSDSFILCNAKELKEALEFVVHLASEGSYKENNSILKVFNICAKS